MIHSFLSLLKREPSGSPWMVSTRCRPSRREVDFFFSLASGTGAWKYMAVHKRRTGSSSQYYEHILLYYIFVFAPLISPLEVKTPWILRLLDCTRPECLSNQTKRSVPGRSRHRSKPPGQLSSAELHADGDQLERSHCRLSLFMTLFPQSNEFLVLTSSQWHFVVAL